MEVVKRIAFIALLGLGACSPSLEIESDTEWTAVVGEGYGREVRGTTYHGSGNRSIDISQNTCWVIQKETAEGYLKAHANDGTIFGINSGEATTTAPYGSVFGCSD